MNTIKYRVKGTDFDGVAPGTIIDALLVCEDPHHNMALIFHGPDKTNKFNLGCLEFARKNANDIYSPVSSKSYVNIEEDKILNFMTALPILA